ncbi:MULTISPECIES: cation:proton antiporter [unclassified Nitratiruptor]|uniref:cation:proton antiporter n=1 Tax=unclassified Nitratiruptor TaxID=2624044 RepID=UPI00191588EB|nr:MULTISPECIES: cation:proton antiporter [unclassified Nitratiruptor]BCD60589.1 cation:proton antiporter [Nitratiruptor sp. YY08-10]BCD64520.1 cation:proton antiporter [Nitratiruptor sp. YY08-14]
MIQEMLQHNIWLISSVILGIVILSKTIAKKTATVDVLWLIVFGALFANLGIIPQHHEVLEYIGEWGIVFIMFALGFDEDLNHFKEGLKRSLGIAIIGAIFPFLAGFLSAKMFGYNDSVALLWGLTMTATAVSLTMVSLKAKNMHKSTATTGIMTAAVVDDVLSLIGVAIIIPLALAATKSGGSLEINFENIGWITIKVILFFAITLIIGLFAFPEKVPKKLPKNATFLQKLDYHLTKLFVPVSIKKLLIMYGGEFTPLIMVFVAMGMGAIADLFGFHPAIGAYIAGLFMKKEYFLFEKAPRPDKIFKESKFVMDHIAFTIFGPIFFVNLGSKIIFDFDILDSIWWQVLVLFGLVFIFQILSAALAAKYTGGYKWHESVMIGLGMLGRAELAFIVINIAYTENKIFDDAQFQTLIFATFLLNISVPLVINWWKPYYEGEKEFKIFGAKLSR